jgi:hypothetical protein
MQIHIYMTSDLDGRNRLQGSCLLLHGELCAFVQRRTTQQKRKRKLIEAQKLNRVV